MTRKSLPAGTAAAPLRLERRRIELRLRHAWTIARGSSDTKTNVLVRVTRGGVEGIGEAAPSARYGESAATVMAALDRLERHLEGGPDRPGEIIDRLEEALPGNHAAKAAIDIALHDRAGRASGTPLWRMLGADPGKAPLTSFSIGIDSVPEMQRKVREAAGFRILKIKLGRGNDREILEGIRAVTDRPLYVDANEGWTERAIALEKIRMMRDMGVVLLEQPLPAADLEGARFLRDRADLPIFADEACLTVHDVGPLRQAYDGINVKLQKAGGLRMARRMIDAARALGMKVMLGCMIETSVGITAAAHLAPLADHADLDGNRLIVDDPFRGATLEDGRLVPPDRPGLGLEGSW